MFGGSIKDEDLYPQAIGFAYGKDPSTGIA